MAKLRMAHASTHLARKPPGPKDKSVKQFTAEIIGNWDWDYIFTRQDIFTRLSF